MDELNDQNNTDSGRTIQDGDPHVDSPQSATEIKLGKRRIWPILLIMTSLAMAIIRFQLSAYSVRIPWAFYKIIMLLLAMSGFGWLIRMDANRSRKTLGYAGLVIGILLISLFFVQGSDRGSLYSTEGIIAVAFLLAAGILFFQAKKINLLSVLGALMVIAGLFHILGIFANAAGVELPASFFIRLNLLYWGGWFLFFWGSQPTAKRILKNMLVVLGITFFSFLILMIFIH